MADVEGVAERCAEGLCYAKPTLWVWEDAERGAERGAEGLY